VATTLGSPRQLVLERGQSGNHGRPKRVPMGAQPLAESSNPIPFLKNKAVWNELDPVCLIPELERC